MMDQSSKEIIDKTVKYVQDTLKDAEGGHDWWHIYRVWNNVKNISGTEKVNLLVVELGALLHDIADSKFNNGDEEIGPEKSRVFLSELDIPKHIVDHVVEIIKNVSYKGGKEARTFNSLELDVVQDADRLDALGAIGIARTFNYGGYKNRVIYDPNVRPDLDMTKEEYKKSTAPTINHFYEKLLLLKDLMNTNTGKKMAMKRHEFLEKYLEQFYQEWEGSL
ncbi:MAG: hypothetical protein ACI8XB_000096 [Patiriisocius sp.]|jgi:uncharacterized protein